MKAFTIKKNDADQRLDRFVAKSVPSLPSSLLQKYIRLKRIKVNGKGSKRDYRMVEGDLVEMYINDEFFEQPSEENAYLRVEKPGVDIIYEDENILLADKRPGLVVHPDENEKQNTLITHIQSYLYQKREWRPREENSFTPALCNRIDRNTGGIVICAKNAEALRIMNQKIKDREMEKYYLCIVHGKMTPAEGKLEGFIFKDEVKKQVYVTQKPQPGAKTAVTLYKTLKTNGKLSLLECELITGRTHQIRAMFASAGHPLLGDGKYGNQAKDKPYGRKYQALYSYRLKFAFTTDAGALEYLNGMEFRAPKVDFEDMYF
ncbi:MAG: RluA family pseudouridine synthase [Ruminococcaceae bacterium]|nr:RluA family pseudouridine synthase [Oscillospiraceae bacterium]